MPRFGFIGGTYTSRSRAVADEECINWYVETDESQDGQAAKSFYWTPGLRAFGNPMGNPIRAMYFTGTRLFVVAGTQLMEIDKNGAQTLRGTVVSDSKPASIAGSNIQLFIVSAGSAYCYTLATDKLTEVTTQIQGAPGIADYSDGYFIVSIKDSNKFQISALFDGETWPGLQVNAVSVFPENIVSIAVDHRELWVFGSKHAVVYYNSGSSNIFDVISGASLELGCAGAFARTKLDNSIFWISEDERGGRMAWRASGYTPQRISTHAIESEWSSLKSVSDAVSYAYQDGGHLFWVIYFPQSNFSWVYDVAENLWHKRAFWKQGAYEPHHSQCHAYAFGLHLVGDWSSGNVYWMDSTLLDDDGAAIRRLRRSPTIGTEMERIFHFSLTVDFQTGLGPQPPLTDADGNPREPQAMLRWSDDRGMTWSNEHTLPCGQSGRYKDRVIWRRLGWSRYRVYELSVTDPIPWVVVDAYINDSEDPAPERRLASKLRGQA
jgi:hypothetical protein